MSIITSSSGGSGGQNGFSGSSRQLFNADPEDTELEKLKQDLTYFKQEIEREGNQEVRITILERIARTEERILALMECQNQHYRQRLKPLGNLMTLVSTIKQTMTRISKILCYSLISLRVN